MKKIFGGVIAVLALVFAETHGNVLCAQDASNKLNMLEIVISNLITRVEALEKRVNALEKAPPGGSVSKMPKKEAVVRETAKSAVTDGFEDIGGGFCVRNVRFNPFGANVLFAGEIANKSEKNYRFAKFTLEIYDDRDLLVKKEEFTVPDLPKDSARPFEHMLIGVETGLINRYVIKATE